MSVLDTMVTDRTQADVNRLRYLLAKGWQNMTADEQAEYTGGTTPLQDSDSEYLYDSDDEQLYAIGGAIRGAYNYTDLNRVETAVAYLASALVQADTDIRQYASDRNVAWDSNFAVPYDPSDFSSITTKTNWDADDVPSATQMNRYLSNISLLRYAIPEYNYSSRPPDSMNNLDYNGANDIEKILVDVDGARIEMIDRLEGYIRSALAVNYSGEIYSGEGEA